MAITTNFAYCLKSHHGSKGILSLATTPYGFFTKTSRFREVSATRNIKILQVADFRFI